MSTETKFTDVYIEYLTVEGYRPELDKDGDIKFKREGGLYLLMPDKDDEEYFRLSFPNFWALKTDAERAKALEACNYTNRVSKVAKLTMFPDNVWANIELYVPNREAFKPVFGRSIRSIGNAVSNFAKRMKEEPPKA
jgi:hypothetical protein